jgi:hypothetical protein
MPPHRAQDKDDEEIVIDGQRVRVPMMLMDEVRHAIGTGGAPIRDAFGLPAGHRPGYCFEPTSAADPRPASYAEYEARITNSWRGEERAVATPTDPPSLPSDTPVNAYEAYESYLREAWRRR